MIRLKILTEKWYFPDLDLKQNQHQALPGLQGNQTSSSSYAQNAAQSAALKQQQKREHEQFRGALVKIIMSSSNSSASSSLPPANGTNKEVDEARTQLETAMGRQSTSAERDILQRYYYYVTNGVNTHQVAEMDERWLQHVLRMLPRALTDKFKPTLNLIANEMKDDYMTSVKKAIVDFVLKDPLDKSEYEKEAESLQKFTW